MWLISQRFSVTVRTNLGYSIGPNHEREQCKHIRDTYRSMTDASGWHTVENTGEDSERELIKEAPVINYECMSLWMVQGSRYSQKIQKYIIMMVKLSWIINRSLLVLWQHRHVLQKRSLFWTLVLFMFLKEVSSAHQSYIYLMKNNKNCNIVKY